MITILLFHHYYCVKRGLSCFHFYWSLVPSLTFSRFLPSLKRTMLTRWIHHRISSRGFTFHHGRLLIFISKRRQHSCGWSFPCQHRTQLFLELYCVSALLCESLGRQARTTGDQPETEQCFTHSSTNRLPCSLQTPCLCGWFSSASLHSHQYLPRKRKQAPLAKKELDRRKKTTPVLPAPKSHPVFNEKNTFHLFLAVSASARGCELRVQFYFWLISKSKTHRWGEKWLHVFTAVDSVMSLAEMRFDFSPVLSVTNDSFHEGAVEPFAVLLDTCCVIYIPRESDESSSRPPFHFLLCCHVKPTDIDAEKCGQRNVSVKKELWFLFSSPVLHRQLWGDGKDLIGPRSQCQRAGQRAVDAAARCRHLWPCRIGHNPYCIVSRQKGTSHGYQTLVYQLPAS